MNLRVLYCFVFALVFRQPAFSQNSGCFLPASDAIRWGYRSDNGDTLIPFRYREVYFFSEGLAVIRTRDHYGYIDATGQTVIPERYDQATPFQNGYALVRRNGTNFLIDQTGRELFGFKGDEAHMWGDIIVYQDPQSFYAHRLALDRKGRQLIDSTSYEFLSLYSNTYPLLVVNDREGYGWLKDKKGNRLTRIGRYFHHIEIVCDNLFAHGAASYRYHKHGKTRNPKTILGGDTLRIYSPEGQLLKTITAGAGYFFKHSGPLPGRVPYGIYDIRRCSVKSVDDWEDQFYDAAGNLLWSISPSQYPEAFKQISAMPDACPFPAPDTNCRQIPLGYINPGSFGCTDSLYLSPYTAKHFYIPYIEKTEALSMDSKEKWGLSVDATPAANKNGCSSHRVTLRNSSGHSIRLLDIKHVYTQLLTKDGWFDFYPYYIDGPLLETNIANNESLVFPIYALYGTYKTQMRVYVKIPNANGKQKIVYSNYFPVGLNPDFRLPHFVRNMQNF